MKKFSNSYVEGIINKAIKGTISTKQASIQLGISKRYVNKLKKKYQAIGIECLNMEINGSKEPGKPV